MKKTDSPTDVRIKSRLAWVFREWIRPILVVVIVTCSLRSAVADWNDVPTGSMKPTILEGDRILVNKLAYDLRIPFTHIRLAKWESPARGEIVVFFSPDQDIRMVKRVVGVPGDTVELRDNHLLINGQPAGYGPLDPAVIGESINDVLKQTHYLAAESVDGDAHPIMLTPGRGAKRSFAPIIVPEDQYFLMGDNRDNSRDSRWFGFVPQCRIVGRSSHVALSLDPDRGRWPRWDRFFHKLP
ncbi:MAG: signal peptidase I [Phycisphaerae bacterium]